MNAAKRLKIRLENHELKIIHFGRGQKFFCEVCQTEMQHLTIAQMSSVLRTSEINVVRFVEEKQLHFFETAEGKLMICSA